MTVVRAEQCSKWYGRVIGVSDLSWQLDGGIVGLVGPNGAGKSTLLKLLAGVIAPSRGSISVWGRPPFADAGVRERIGYVPEHDQMWDELDVLELVTALAELAGVPHARAQTAAEDAIARVGMTYAQHRYARELSKGMRQRVKLASAIAHDPELLLLDEPLNGIDPVARVDLVAQIRALGAAGKTIVVAGHVLDEIAALTSDIALIDRGRMVAEGNVAEIRRLLALRPHRVRVECDRPRAAAAALIACEHVAGVAVEPSAVVIETRDLDRCFDDIAALARGGGVTVASLVTLDDDLRAVFDHLTAGGGAP